MPHAVSPTVDRDDAFFWDGVAQGKLLLRRCRTATVWQHPPTPMCPACGSLEWDAQELSGRGPVHSWIVSRHPTEPDDCARIVALVELDEGVRLVSNLAGGRARRREQRHGGRGHVQDVEGVTLPQFRPAGGGA